MNNKNSTKGRVGKAVCYAALVLIAVILLFPYLFMINRGLMSNEYVIQPKTRFFPDGIHFENFLLAFREGGYRSPLLNSIIVSAVVTISVPFSSFVAAYAFARLEFVGKKFLFSFMMLTILLPAIVTQVPMYVLYNDLRLTNTLSPLFLPGLFFGGAMNVFLCRQFLLGIPKALEESAILDGAGAVRRCFSICAPLCMPILIYLSVTAFIGVWGDYLTPSMYNNSSEAPYTLAYALYKMTSSETNSRHPEWIFAAATITSLVPVVLYSVFQKYLVEGIAVTGLKG